MKKGIIYAPDFVVNAGGIINVYYELEGYVRERAMKHAEGIYNTTYNILQIAKSENIPTFVAANRIAENRIAAIGKIKMSF
jgi:leucine dehydrogenase